jgi:hypothetical protein
MYISIYEAMFTPILSHIHDFPPNIVYKKTVDLGHVIYLYYSDRVVILLYKLQ